MDILKLREDFLSFVPVNDVTSKGFAKTLLENLKLLGLDLTNMWGRGYDGAVLMPRAFSGVQTIVQNSYYKALYTHIAWPIV